MPEQPHTGAGQKDRADPAPNPYRTKPLTNNKNASSTDPYRRMEPMVFPYLNTKKGVFQRTNRISVNGLTGKETPKGPLGGPWA